MEFKKTKLTIDEVAKAAGVSKTTISRYLNERYEYMSQETREKIKKVIEDLDYRPNNLARSLKSNKSQLIGVTVADISSPFSSILVRGIGDICKNNGYNLIIVNTDNDAEKEKEYLMSLIDQRVEGIIVNTTGENKEFLKEINDSGIPIVLADRTFEEPIFDSVVCNNYEITAKAIKHLIESGFKKIAFFTQAVANVSTRYERRNAFLDVCAKMLGIDAKDMVFTVSCEDDSEITNTITDFKEKAENEPAAIFTVNGVTLLKVLQGINRLKLNIPSDIGVCGYDDWGWSNLIPPGITTISQPSYQVGAEAAKRLMARIRQKKNLKYKKLVLSSELEIRGSTVLR